MKYTVFSILIFLAQSETFAQCWQSISSGSIHSAGIHTDGTLWTWGWNNYGQLGDGTVVPKNAPIQIGTDQDWAMISTGNMVDLNLAIGGDHNAAIKTNGTLWVWGRNNFGQLGNGTFVDQNIPLQIGTATNWAAVKAGPLHTVAIKTDGTLWAWGYNQYGQLGLGNTTDVNVPTQVGTATNWQHISNSDEHSLAIGTDGSLWSWGKNNFYQLGFFNDNTNKLEPTRIGLDTNWVSITTGRDFSFAIRSNGTIWGWGRNDNGQLGLGNVTSYHPVPEQIGSDTIWNGINGGQAHVLATRTDGNLWGWGYNFDGQLGQGNNTFFLLSEVPIASSEDAIIVSAGANSSHSIKTDGSLWAWGRNWEGALGIGSLNDSNIPLNINCSPPLSIISSNTSVKTGIFPNPTTDYANFHRQAENLRVMDLAGKVVFSRTESITQIDLSFLQQGVYIIHYNSDGQIINERLIKH